MRRSLAVPSRCAESIDRVGIPSSPPVLTARSRGIVRLAQVVAVVAGAVALSVLVGYATKALPEAGTPRLQGMSPFTALGLEGVALSILLETRRHTALAAFAGQSAAVIGICFLGVHVFFGHDAISPLVLSAVFSLDPSMAGRMSIATALCLTALGTATLLRNKPFASDAAAAVALFVSALALIGYAYGVHDFYAIPLYRTMALHTAATIFALALVSMMVNPETGWLSVVASPEASGNATRRQMAFTLLPPVAGWILVKAIEAHQISPASAMALLVILTVAPLLLLILRDGRVLDALACERRDRNAMQIAHAQELELRLARQAAELASAGAERERAEAAMQHGQRMEAIGRFTGGIAHDFNNLLMAIGGNLQLLKRHLPLDHPARRFADNAAVAADRGAKLTGQLLSFSRIHKVAIRAVELDPALSEACSLLRNALGPSIEVDMQLAAPGHWAMTDPGQLELAILNLAVNARDAMPDGGKVTVSSSYLTEPIEGGSDRGGSLSVKVSDTGTGMPPEIAARAIEPFFTTKDKGKGTGLGLAQVYNFVRQCGGDLRVASTIGLGTGIELRLPCAPAVPSFFSAADAAKPAEMAALMQQDKRRLVLVIDDDDSVRAVLVDALKVFGFEVVEARDGEAGLACLDRLRPVAAVIDFLMPGLNGAETARCAQRRVPGLPIVLVSGVDDDVALDGITDAAVLRKPFNVNGLHEAMTSLLH